MRAPKARSYGAQPPARAPKARSYGTRPSLHDRAGTFASIYIYIHVAIQHALIFLRNIRSYVYVHTCLETMLT